MTEAKSLHVPSPSERMHAIGSAVELLKAGGLLHRTAEDQRLDGRTITLGARPLVNFGSCSYLGLETDTRLKAAACEAVLRYGVQFSSSRAFVSAPLYKEYEELLSRVCGDLPVVISQTTSLGHMAALPVLVRERDAVLFDSQVHNSVQAVIPTLQRDGIHCECVAHNRLDRVEERIQALAATHERVFYLCDGVYSMQGDLLDVPELWRLLDRQPRAFAYIDDAHGAGWTGRHGAGIVLGRHGIHPRMVVTLGLSKAFAAAGCALVFPTQELANQVFSCGSTLIFSGPLQPAQLGAGIASARIMLSNELPKLQAEVEERIALFDLCASREGFSAKARGTAPVRWVETGAEATAVELGAALQQAGFFVNTAICPAVPRGRAGVRIMLTRQQALDDVRELCAEIGRKLRARGALRPTSLVDAQQA